MSARLPSCWLFAAALLAVEALTSAAVAQSPAFPGEPKGYGFPQAAPAPLPPDILPVRGTAVPLLLEQEQVGEHGDLPRAQPALPALPPPAPRVIRGSGLPECDSDDGRSPEVMTLRCLLFTIHPLAAFLPIQVWIPAEEVEKLLPPAQYLEHPPQYCPPGSGCPRTNGSVGYSFGPTQVPEQVGMPEEFEHIEVMPTEVEPLDVMPDVEERDPQYQFLGLWTDFTGRFTCPACPLAEITVGVKEEHTGSLLFGIGIEVSQTGTIVVNAEPTSATAEPIPVLPKETNAVSGSSHCRATTRDMGRAAASPQVQLSVVIAEVERTAARTLNLDRAGEKKAPRWVIEVADGDRQKALQASLDELREKGRAKVLAQPCLMTLSGRPASFLSGGQQAVPVPAGLGEAGVQFEDFGTRVNCLPVVLPDGTIRLEVEPEISELCEVTNGTVQGTIVPGRSSQRVHTTADIARGHALVICGPKAGGDSRLVLLVTPTVVEPPAATGAAPALLPQLLSTFTDALRECLDHLFGCLNNDVQRRTLVLMNQSEHFGPIEYEKERTWLVDQPTHLTPERVRGGIGGDEETVHDLLVKCQRELSRGHYAGAEDLAQRALQRDRKSVVADPLVTRGHLLERVKETASLPLGTVDPCETKPEGAGTVPAGEAKAIGSPERMVEALLQEFNVAYKEARYRDAEAVAGRAVALDPENACAAAALSVARMQRWLVSREHLVRAVSSAAPAPSVAPGKTEKERQIERRLDAHVSLNFKDVALGKVLDELATTQDINILPDGAALDEKGISLTMPVTFHIEDMSLKGALKNLLNNFHLTYVVEDEALKITTPDNARGKCVLVPYSVGGLLPADAKSSPETQQLINLIQSAIAPRTWASQGGQGTIDFLAKPATILVNQTSDVQEEVADLFALLRRCSGEAAERERKRAAAIARFQSDFKAGRYEEARVDALQAFAAVPGNTAAVAALQQACEALARQPRPEALPQCTYVGSGPRPVLPNVDPAVVRALQKILIDGEKGGPAGGLEEAEPKEANDRPAPRR